MNQKDNVIQIDIKKYNMNKITCKTTIYKKNLYNILNYNRDYICSDDHISSKYRSVIVSNDELLSLSHPKSLSNDLFFNKYADINNLWIDECIEGVMIHLFYDYAIESWEIATRNAVGGDYKFYNKNAKTTNSKTFYAMFLEAMECDNLQKLPFRNSNLCYNFILQHPENNLIIPVNKPTVYLVGIYRKLNKNGVVQYLSPDIYQKWEYFRNTPIQFPKKYEGTSYSELCDKYTSIYSGYHIKGLMVTDISSGEHTLLKNVWYEAKKNEKKDQSHILFMYLSLNYTKKIAPFLLCFPFYKALFKKFRDQYDILVNGLHQSYLSKYVYKYNTIIMDKYLHHIDRIHREIYIDSLNRGTRTNITRGTVKKYVGEMQPMQLYHLLAF